MARSNRQTAQDYGPEGSQSPETTRRPRQHPQQYPTQFAKPHRNRGLRALAPADSRRRAVVAVERIVELEAEPAEACSVAVVDAASRRRRSLRRLKENCHPVGFRMQVRLTPQSVFRGRL